MNSSNPIAEKLLDSIGRVSGQTIRLIEAGRLRDFVNPDALPADLLDRLATESRKARTPCALHTDDGRWLGAFALGGEGQRRLLYSCHGANLKSNERVQADSLTVLQNLGELIETGETAELETVELIEQLSTSYEDLNLFSRLTSRMRSLHNWNVMIEGLLKETLDAMHVDLVAVLLDDPSMPDTIVTRPTLDKFLLPHPMPFLKAINKAMPRFTHVFEGNCYIINDSEALDAVAGMHTQRFRAIQVAIRSGAGTHYGWLTLLSFDMETIFRRSEYRILSTMAEQFSLVLANTELYRDLERFVINMVRSFVAAIEAKDPYTKGHSERVSVLSMRIGSSVGLTPKQYANLQWGSILHDVGKIGTPEAILNKPGKLTREEYDILKEHPGKGAEILRPIAQLVEALPAVRNHHERIDGRGYPDELAGEEIPFLARIVAVADTYDAITSTRAYRDARTHDQAMEIIRDCAGAQLDATLVEVFADLMSRPVDAQDLADATSPIDRMSTAALFQPEKAP